MNQDYWLKQTDKPLFPELEWSRPENRAQAGKLLIVGGTGYEFAAPANAYGDVLEAGIGTAKVLLPDSMRKTVEQLFSEADFAPSTPSGSFAAATLAELLDLSTWADGVLLPGDIGRNSETTVLLENFFTKYDGQVTLTRDAADIFCQQPSSIIGRPNTLLVLAFGQLRQLASSSHFPTAFTTDVGLVALVETLYAFTQQTGLQIITKYLDQYVVASDNKISTTKLKAEKPIWRLETAAHASVWWLQNPQKPFEAITTSLIATTS